MVSPMLRRSGVAVCLILELLKWRPRHVIQVGVGINHKELEVMQEAWGPCSEQWTLDGFEPNPAVAQAIRPHYPGQLMEVAIGDQKGWTRLYYRKNHKDGSSVYPLDGETVLSCEVPLATLDSLYPDPPQQTLLWLDCEGSELAAIRGGQHVLAHCQAVNVEMTSRPSHDGPSNTEQVHEALTAAGFYRQWVHTSRVSAGQSDCLYLRRGVFSPELCCCPCSITAYRSDCR